MRRPNCSAGESPRLNNLGSELGLGQPPIWPPQLTVYIPDDLGERLRGVIIERLRRTRTAAEQLYDQGVWSGRSGLRTTPRSPISSFHPPQRSLGGRGDRRRSCRPAARSPPSRVRPWEFPGEVTRLTVIG